MITNTIELMEKVYKTNNRNLELKIKIPAFFFSVYRTMFINNETRFSFNVI